VRPLKLTSLLSAGLGLVAVSHPAYAQNNNDDEIVVTGLRQAYQGDFAPLETPQSNQVIDEDLLRNVGAINLNDALDLSASVARQNNFGGLWNSFSIRGFSGDINLPSGFLVNGFNAGRGFGGPRDLVGVESVEILTLILKREAICKARLAAGINIVSKAMRRLSKKVMAARRVFA